MKNLLLICLALFSASVFGQTSALITPQTMTVPKYPTSFNINSIPSPVSGMLAYDNSSDKKLYLYNYSWNPLVTIPFSFIGNFSSAIPIHLVNTGSTLAHCIQVENSSLSGGAGLRAYAKATSPTANTYGLYGYNESTNNLGYGVFGSHAGSGTGIFGSSATGRGIYGYSNGISGTGYGVFGYAENSNGTGVWGASDGGVGVQGSGATIGGLFSGGYSIITNGGNVGIGINNPNDLLDVNGRARLRHNGNTSGIWMNNSANSLSFADGAFYGMKTDTEAGIYIGNGWRFWVNSAGVTNSTGGISVGGGETIAKVMKRSVVYDMPSIPSGGSFIFPITVTGVSIGDNVVFNPSQYMFDITINYCYVSATDVVSLHISNHRASAQDPPSMNYLFTIFK